MRLKPHDCLLLYFTQSYWTRIDTWSEITCQDFQKFWSIPIAKFFFFLPLPHDWYVAPSCNFFIFLQILGKTQHWMNHELPFIDGSKGAPPAHNPLKVSILFFNMWIFGLSFERPYLKQSPKLVFMRIMVRLTDYEYNPQIMGIIHGLLCMAMHCG